METLVTGVDYDFELSHHAKVHLAFRHRLAVPSDTLTAVFEGKHKHWTDGTPLFRLTLLSGKKLPVILRGRKIITVYPNTAVMRSNAARDFCHSISTALDVRPDLYSLDEIVEWSRRFEEEQGNLKVHHLQRDIRAKASAWSQETSSLVEALADARSVIERLECENRALLQASTSEQSAQSGLAKLSEAPAVEVVNSELVHIAAPAVHDDKDIHFGIGGDGELVGLNGSGNPIYRFGKCQVIEVREAESPGSAHEIVFSQSLKTRVLSTNFKNYLKAYEPGDTEIFTAFVNGRHYLNGKTGINPLPASSTSESGNSSNSAVHDPSQARRLSRLMAIKAFYLGRGMFDSPASTTALELIQKKLAALETENNPELEVLVFYNLLAAEMTRDHSATITLREKARALETGTNSNLFDLYMELVEAIQRPVKLDHMTGRYMMGRTVLERRDLKSTSLTVDIGWAVDEALDDLGYADGDLSEKEMTFIYETSLKDLLRSDRPKDWL